ncbi:hypothetical protein Bbelb_343540 [Branchiostoma belcheri]|nr:hypothetical protein Bbelb_343540 [Branchiostoma belcheri]
MALVLTTDESAGYPGFKIRFEEVPQNGYRTGDNFAVGSVASFGCNDGFTLRGRQNTTCETAGVRGWDIYDLSSVNDLPKCKALCGGHITGRRFGVVYSPYYSERYDINMNCTWTIEVDSGRVKLTPEMFDLETNHDYLTVYDGNGSVLGKYSGDIRYIPEDIHSTSNKISLVFTTDHIANAWGFKIYYEAECGAHITRLAENIRRSESCATNSSKFAPDYPGNIYSPNYPGQYGNNMECTWTIEVDVGKGIKLTTVAFSLEEGHDRLLLYKGYPITNSTLIGEYTGSRIPREILVTSNLIHLVLITDDSSTTDGFKIHYEAFLLLRPPCFDPGVPENGFRHGDIFTVASVVTFGCNDGFTLKGQEKLNCMSGYQSAWNGPLPTCKAECGGYRTANVKSPGVLYSPNYPAPYGNNLNCTWTIATVNEGMGINMTIAEFSLQDRRDRLSIYAGDHISNYTLLGEYSGRDVPREVISTSKIIHVVLITDETVSADGFKIHYEGYYLVDGLCPDPGLMANGITSWVSFAVGSTVSFDCYDGHYDNHPDAYGGYYALRGPSNITCMPSKKWNSRPPTCEDATTCKREHVLLEEEGEIKSPAYRLGRTYHYPDNVDCSHNDMVLVDVNLALKRNRKPKRKVYIRTKADEPAIKKDLTNYANNCHKRTQDMSVTQKWSDFKDKMKDTMNKHIPSKITSSRYNLPWFNRNLRRHCRKKQRLYNKAKKTGQEEDWNKYKRVKKGVQKSIRQAHSKYVADILGEAIVDKPKIFWSYIKGLRKDLVGVAPLKVGNTIISDSGEKAEVLSSQFKSVFTEEDTTDMPSLGQPCTPPMEHIVVSTGGVEKMLQGLNSSKASGPDQIQPWFLKLTANEIAPVLTNIFQHSLNTAEIPKDWRDANICAIFKKGDRAVPSNYRPVSLTCISCKLLEHIIHSQIMKHLESNSTLTDYQHGFRAKRSTETQLMLTVHDIHVADALNSKRQVDLAILDFTKAFNKVPHGRLISKPEYYGIQGPTLNWLKAFLTNREQTVVVEGKASAPVKVASGVPRNRPGTIALSLVYK